MRSIVAVIAAAALVLGLASGASAELYFAGSVGGSLPFNQSLTGENPHSVGYSDFDPTESVVVVGKGGYWLDNFPYLGFEGGASVFFPDIDEQDFYITEDGSQERVRIQAEVDVISAFALLMGRFPIGPVTVYGGGGVAIQHVDYSNMRINGVGVRADDDTIPAVQVEGGVKYYFTPNIALFAEYMFTTGNVDTTFGPPGDPSADVHRTVDIDFDNQFIHGGVEYRFNDPFAK